MPDRTDPTATTAPGDPTAASVPLSLTQEQLWVLDRLAPGNASYNTTMMYRLDGPFEADVLARALEQIMSRQQMLRTAIVDVDGVPRQTVAEDVAVPLTVTDLTHLPEDKHETQAQEHLRQAVHRPFDLRRAPLFRVELIRLGAERHLMALVIHHIVSDGWSLQVLLQEVADLYASLVTGTEVTLPPLPAQFADYARGQRERLAGPRGRALVEYWTKQLAGAPRGLGLPTDRPRPAEASFRGDRLVFQVPPELRGRLNTLARQTRTSLFMVTLAGFKAMLSRITGDEDLVVGTPVGNRDRPEWSALVGYFADTLVMRTDLSGDPAFAELLTRVRTTALGAFAHRDLPFRTLVEKLAPERAVSRNPLFQVMFILQNIPARRRRLELSGVTLTRLDDIRSTAIFDLRLDLFEFEDELRGQLEYSTDLFDRPTIERLVTQYLALLTDACSAPERRLSELSLGATAFTDGFNDDLGEW
ncbi:condensation domain-containing protein [Streptomyces mexicanus]|jgi:non-ribosomal peptide synthetase component F|uniref:condensation domain-containing protein n=1 Tax=Streptomyces mexicanus TaxID=178566 RepID=UPI0036C93E6A